MTVTKELIEVMRSGTAAQINNAFMLDSGNHAASPLESVGSVLGRIAHAIVAERAGRYKAVRDQIDVQGQNGNWNYNPYMHGMYNGLECALATLECREPEYRDKPDEWLADREQPEVYPVSNPEPVAVEDIVPGWYWLDRGERCGISHQYLAENATEGSLLKWIDDGGDCKWHRAPSPAELMAMCQREADLKTIRITESGISNLAFAASVIASGEVIADESKRDAVDHDMRFLLAGLRDGYVVKQADPLPNDTTGDESAVGPYNHNPIQCSHCERAASACCQSCNDGSNYKRRMPNDTMGENDDTARAETKPREIHIIPDSLRLNDRGDTACDIQLPDGVATVVTAPLGDLPPLTGRADTGHLRDSVGYTTDSPPAFSQEAQEPPAQYAPGPCGVCGKGDCDDESHQAKIVQLDPPLQRVNEVDRNGITSEWTNGQQQQIDELTKRIRFLEQLNDLTKAPLFSTRTMMADIANLKAQFDGLSNAMLCEDSRQAVEGPPWAAAARDLTKRLDAADEKRKRDNDSAYSSRGHIRDALITVAHRVMGDGDELGKLLIDVGYAQPVDDNGYYISSEQPENTRLMDAHCKRLYQSRLNSIERVLELFVPNSKTTEDAQANLNARDYIMDWGFHFRINNDDTVREVWRGETHLGTFTAAPMDLEWVWNPVRAKDQPDEPGR